MNRRARTWIEFLERHNICWVNWSLGDKDETTAVLNPGASTTGGWSYSELSTPGKLVRELLRQR